MIRLEQVVSLELPGDVSKDDRFVVHVCPCCSNRESFLSDAHAGLTTCQVVSILANLFTDRILAL